MADERRLSRWSLEAAWKASWYWVDEGSGDGPANYNIDRDAWLEWFNEFYDCAMRWELAPERLAEKVKP